MTSLRTGAILSPAMAWLTALLLACSLTACGASHPAPRLPAPDFRPVADFETVRTVVFNGSGGGFGHERLIRAVLDTLPAGVDILLYVSHADELEPALKRFGIAARSVRRFKAVVLAKGTMTRMGRPRGNSLWARDALPFPLVNETASGPDGRYALMDSRYGLEFEPDRELADVFGLPLFVSTMGFDGGNLLADTRGNCFCVATKAQEKKMERALTVRFGCKRVIVLPPDGGIGHVDERLMLLGDRILATDSRLYRDRLLREGFTPHKGYRVVMLPRRPEQGEIRGQSYANGLLINYTLFLPQFDDPLPDGQAMQALSALGLRVVPVDALLWRLDPSAVSAKKVYARGGPHCLIRTYPFALPEK